MSKIVELDNLPTSFAKLKKSLKVVVMAHGCFDCMHLGHIKHLQQAKSFGDALIVTVTSNRYVNKGAGRPIFGHDERAEALAALSCVDYVAISDYPDACIAISKIQPSLLVKGNDYNFIDILYPEMKAVEDYGGKVRFTVTQKYSTTEIINRIKQCS